MALPRPAGLGGDDGESDGCTRSIGMPGGGELLAYLSRHWLSDIEVSCFGESIRKLRTRHGEVQIVTLRDSDRGREIGDRVGELAGRSANVPAAVMVLEAMFGADIFDVRQHAACPLESPAPAQHFRQRETVCRGHVHRAALLQ